MKILFFRDESACHTYYFTSKENARNSTRSNLIYRNIKFGKGHLEERVKQVLFSIFDSAGNLKIYYFQVHFRANECSRILDFFLNLNKGDIPHNVMDDVPNSLDIKFNLKDLVGNLDTDCITMSGHSFGGATALLTLSQRPELKQDISLIIF